MMLAWRREAAVSNRLWTGFFGKLWLKISLIALLPFGFAALADPCDIAFADDETSKPAIVLDDSKLVANDEGLQSEGDMVVVSATNDHAENATENWEPLGTCEWKLENGVLVIRPAKDSAEGELPSLGIVEEVYKNSSGVIISVAYRNQWPWSCYGSAITKVQLQGALNAGNSVQGLFQGLRQCKIIEGLDGLNVSKTVNMSQMFSDCQTLTALDLSHLDTKNVQDMSSMFEGCRNLRDLCLGEFDTSCVVNMSSMFSSCSALYGLNLSRLDTSKVTDMSGMLIGCDLRGIDCMHLNTGSVVNMSSMMAGCKADKIKPLFDTRKVESMRAMFTGCTAREIDVSSFDTSNVKDRSLMFAACTFIKSLDLSRFCTSKVTNMSHMFGWSEGYDAAPENLEELNLCNFDTSGVSDADGMFSYADKLSRISIGSKFTLQSLFPDSVWRNTSGVGFRPNALPRNTKNTYAAEPGTLTHEGVWFYSDGKWRYRLPSGHYSYGWQNIYNSWHYFNAEGTMQAGWLKLDDKWYYLAPDSGIMVTNWNKIGNSWYYFASSGSMLTGWQKVGGTWYHFNGSGVMSKDCWVGNYYLTSSGAMATNAWVGRYHVGASGKWDMTR